VIFLYYKLKIKTSISYNENMGDLYNATITNEFSGLYNDSYTGNGEHYVYRVKTQDFITILLIALLFTIYYYCLSRVGQRPIYNSATAMRENLRMAAREERQLVVVVL